MRVDGNDVAIPGSRPARILSVLLIDANRRVSLDALISAVWGDDARDSTVGTLESHVWRLRKVMEPGRGRRVDPTFLINDSGGYRLVVDPENADSLRFTQLADQGDRLLAAGDAQRALTRFEQALDLWRGRPFEAVADEFWAAAPVARLEERFAQVNEGRIDALLRTGSVDRAVSQLEELVAALPFRERLWTQLMLGLYQAGRIAESLAAYARARAVLLDTLGLEPGPALRAMQQRILEQDPELQPARPAATQQLTSGSEQARTTVREVHLPSRLSTLVGRDLEIDRVGRLLRRSRLLTLVGVAGCGKTRLAIEVARTAHELAPDGVWFIDLGSADDASAIAEVFASTIGLDTPAVGGAVSALRSYVRDRDVLLVVDNCEHVLGAVHKLLDVLLAENEQFRVLATSREPIGLDGEVLWTLAPLAVLDTPPTHPLDVEACSPAARLFLDRAHNADPRFEPERDLAVVEAICALVDGIPLAIELAAGRIRSASLGEVHRQVSTELAGLGRSGYSPTAHHRTVELSIEWSVRLLPGDERLAHSRLSVLPGYFTLDLAQAVLGAPPIRPAAVPDLLNQLVHRSLLAVVPGDGADTPTRFRQLATVRAHAAGTLDPADGAPDRRDAWAERLTTVRSRTDRQELRRLYHAVDHNYASIRATLQRQLLDQPSVLGARLAGWLHGYWWYRGMLLDALRWLEVAVAVMERLESDGARIAAIETAWVRLGLAKMLAHRARVDLALPHIERAYEVETALPPEHRAAYGLDLAILAGNVWSVGDTALARQLVERVYRLNEDSADRALGIIADATACLVECDSVDPDVTETRATKAYHDATAENLDVAAWTAARAGSHAALTAGDAQTGLLWSGRVIRRHRRDGGELGGAFLEIRANFLALAGNYRGAAVLYAAARTHLQREGLLWRPAPRTDELRARTRAALSSLDYEEAGREGENLDLATIADTMSDSST